MMDETFSGSVIASFPELLSIRFNPNVNVDCYNPCATSPMVVGYPANCPVELNEEATPSTRNNPPNNPLYTKVVQIPCHDGSFRDEIRPDLTNFPVPTILYRLRFCDGSERYVFEAEKATLNPDDYVELQTIEINSSQQLFGFSESCGNQKYVGLDAIVVALENSENVAINDYILTDGNCDPQTPDCTDLEQQQQQDYIDALKAENKVADDFEYPMYLIRVMLCDGSEVYLTITELQNLPGTYIELQRIFIENEEQTFQVGSTLSSLDMEDLFYLSLHYDDQDASIGNVIQKNGNISYMTWQTKGMNEQIYKFQYDALNRIKLATFGERTAGSLDFNNLYGASFENYDANGNIGKIARYGPTITDDNGNIIYGCKTLIDDLTLSYSGNQINTVADVVSDAVNRLRGFKANTSSVLAYGYDANGNLISDPHKGLVVSYNHLNLPEYFDFGNGDVIDILYDAEGRKLQKAVGGSMLAQKDYCQEFEYGDKSLAAIYNSEGRVVRNGGNWEFEYFLRDHLGSNRVVFKEGVDGLEVLQETHNYPFGGLLEGKWNEIQPAVNQDYTYTGKELNKEYDLQLIDFGSRWLNPWVGGTWLSIDPLVEDFTHLSPYIYSYNNPIAFVDLEGESGVPTIEGNTLVITSVLYFYGNKATQELATQTAENIQNAWNAPNSQVTYEGNTYNVEFRVSGVAVSENFAALKAASNKTPLNNFIRVEDGTVLSKAGGKGSFWAGNTNAGYFVEGDLGNNKTTDAHEMGHGYDWYDANEHDTSHDNTISNGVPGIMTQRGVRVADKYGYKGQPAGKKTVDPKKRKVLASDVQNIVNRIRKDSNGKLSLGKVSNKIFKENPFK